MKRVPPSHGRHHRLTFFRFNLFEKINSITFLVATFRKGVRAIQMVGRASMYIFIFNG